MTMTDSETHAQGDATSLVASLFLRVAAVNCFRQYSQAGILASRATDQVKCCRYNSGHTPAVRELEEGVTAFPGAFYQERAKT
jgi:hypothetical protein